MSKCLKCNSEQTTGGCNCNKITTPFILWFNGWWGDYPTEKQTRYDEHQKDPKMLDAEVFTYRDIKTAFNAGMNSKLNTSQVVDTTSANSVEKYKCYSGTGDYLIIQEQGKTTPCVIIGEDGAGHQVQEHICKLLNENFPNGFPEIDNIFYEAGEKVKVDELIEAGVLPKPSQVESKVEQNLAANPIENKPCDPNGSENCRICGECFNCVAGRGYVNRNKKVESVNTHEIQARNCDNCATSTRICVGKAGCRVKGDYANWTPIESKEPEEEPFSWDSDDDMPDGQ